MPDPLDPSTPPSSGPRDEAVPPSAHGLRPEVVRQLAALREASDALRLLASRFDATAVFVAGRATGEETASVNELARQLAEAQMGAAAKLRAVGLAALPWAGDVCTAVRAN